MTIVQVNALIKVSLFVISILQNYLGFHPQLVTWAYKQANRPVKRDHIKVIITGVPNTLLKLLLINAIYL